jgi:ATP-binding cassette subfamily B protein
MPTNGHSIPAELERLLKEQAITDKEPVICVCSHMTQSADYGKTWLAIGDRRVSVIRNSDGFKVTSAIDLDKLTGAKTLPFIGGGALSLDIDGKSTEVLRFPASQAGLFGSIAGNLQKTARRIEPPKEPEKKEGEAVVEKKPEPPKPPPEPPVAIDVAMKAIKIAVDEDRERHCGKCARQYPKHTKVCPYCVSRGRTLFRIFSFARPYRFKIVCISLLMTLSAAIQLVPPRLTKLLLDKVLVPRDTTLLASLVAALFATMVAQAVIAAVRSRLAIWVGANVTNSIRMKAYNHLQILSLGYFEKRQVGALMSRVSHDSQNIEGFLVEGIQFTVINILLLVGIAIDLLIKNPTLGIIVIIPAPIVLLISKLVWKKIMVGFRKWWDSVSRMNAFLSDSLNGTREIKATGQERRTISRFEERSMDTTNRTIIAEQNWQTLLPLLSLIIQSSSILVWYFGGKSVIESQMTVGDLVEYLTLMGLMYGPLQLLTRLNDWLARSTTAAERVFELIDTQPDVIDAPSPMAMDKVVGRIELREVTFGYEKHKPVLKNLTLDIAPGQMIGLVGKSGSGKSTLIKLVMRLYDVDQGGIFVDGVDIRQISKEAFHRQVSVVMQDPFMFNGSIAENIAFGRPDATQMEIIKAAVAANAHEFIMRLPNGYDSQVGERGAKLSGGERQRIAIARALVMDPKILILDEATSSVDTETEQKIQQALERLVKGRTTIAIAHRLSTLRHAHHLVVMENGEVKEKGSHDELMAKEDGIYHKLVTIQTEWARTVAVGA